jgi:hypothetical protein
MAAMARTPVLPEAIVRAGFKEAALRSISEIAAEITNNNADLSLASELGASSQEV